MWQNKTWPRCPAPVNAAGQCRVRREPIELGGPSVHATLMQKRYARAKKVRFLPLRVIHEALECFEAVCDRVNTALKYIKPLNTPARTLKIEVAERGGADRTKRTADRFGPLSEQHTKVQLGGVCENVWPAKLCHWHLTC